MKFQELFISGAFLVELEPHHDVRGYFARTWCAKEFEKMGLCGELVQSSVSFNKTRGTVRGMHMQLPPSQEAKLVRCTRGSILDVIVDLRPDSSTFMRHCQVELRAELGNAIYIPPLLAHGFQTLADDTEVFYQMTDVFAPHLSTGWRWNDPVFNIQWPVDSNITIGQRDATYADFNEDQYRTSLAKS